MKRTDLAKLRQWCFAQVAWTRNWSSMDLPRAINQAKLVEEYLLTPPLIDIDEKSGYVSGVEAHRVEDTGEGVMSPPGTIDISAGLISEREYRANMSHLPTWLNSGLSTLSEAQELASPSGSPSTSYLPHDGQPPSSDLPKGQRLASDDDQLCKPVSTACFHFLRPVQLVPAQQNMRDRRSLFGGHSLPLTLFSMVVVVVVMVIHAGRSRKRPARNGIMPASGSRHETRGAA